MEFGKAFTFAFEDQDWLKKIGIAGLVLLIPIIGQFVVMGWALEIMRRVIFREPELLPDWSAFGDYLVKGLKGFVIGLVYALPVILLQACLQGGLTAVTGNADSQTQEALGFVAICIGCIAGLLGLVLGLLGAVGMTKFVATDDLGAAFRFGEVFGLLRAAPGAWITAFLGVLVAGILASLGIILCVIGVIFTAAWAYTVQGNLFGQAYRAAAGGQSPVNSFNSPNF